MNFIIVDATCKCGLQIFGLEFMHDGIEFTILVCIYCDKINIPRAR